jgi:hypothetical protein
MAKVRKPIPPTQRELSLKQHTAFDPEQGNPNLFAENGKTNRSLNLSFKDDTTKPFSVGIKDIDEAIFYYFQNIIKPTVVQNGQVLPVPVVYASPEKMKSYQKDGYYRDQNGKIQAPLIAFKRESIDKNRTIANKLDANNPNNFGVFTKKYNPKNAYDNFHVLNNRVPVKTNYAVVMPDYLTITYSFTVFTYYVEQLNKIVEAIEYASDAYWGDPQLFQFRAMIDSFNFQTELNTSDERLVRSTFTVKLNGYIVPEVIQRDLNAVKKFNDKAKILLAIETDVSFEDVKSNVPIKKPNFLSNVPPFTCFPATVSNSGSTYNSSVNSGGTLILPNQTINVNNVGSGLIPSVGTIGINLTDSVNPITPTSVNVTGRNVNIIISSSGTPYMVATGGTITTDGDYRIHTFTSSGNFEVLTLGVNPIVDFMLVAGGGSGGKSTGGNSAGGGGAGGLIYIENQSITLGVKPIVIGNGGVSRTVAGVTGLNGQNSTFLGNTAIGGGGGSAATNPGGDGGSGGGGSFVSANGTGTTGQGFSGGAYIGADAGCGGGGAGQSGLSAFNRAGANGGIGRQTYINGTTNYFAGGGGGSPYATVNIGLGGNGGGGNGGYAALPPINGTANTGGGGGGGYDVDSGAGGSGVCIIRYRFQ